MTGARVPSLLHDLVVHSERVSAIYTRCGDPESFLRDQNAMDAVLWNFVVIGEVCGRLGDAFHRAHPTIPWREVIAQRHVIAHGYDVLDWNRLALVIERDIPTLILEARRLLESFGPPPSEPI